MRRTLLAPSVMAAFAIALPAGAQAAPNGNGLFQHTADVCTPPVGSTEMLLTGGRSLWIGDHHYLIHSYTTGDYSGFGHGEMAGLAERGTTECTGALEESVTSVDYLVR